LTRSNADNPVGASVVRARPPIYRLGPLLTAERISAPEQATTTRGPLVNTTGFHGPGRMVGGDRYKNIAT
jgi:hypothetical protein